MASTKHKGTTHDIHPRIPSNKGLPDIQRVIKALTSFEVTWLARTHTHTQTQKEKRQGSNGSTKEKTMEVEVKKNAKQHKHEAQEVKEKTRKAQEET